MKTIKDINIHHKRVVIRVDFNVPMKGGDIRDDSRIKAALPTIKYALSQQAAVILLSHLGRPQAGVVEEMYSLYPASQRLAELLQQEVAFAQGDWLSGVNCDFNEVVLCENVRFLPGERQDSPELGQKMAALGNVFVMDAFASAHRAEASTHAIAEFAPEKCVGLLVAKEVAALEKAMDKPAMPLTSIVGGAKVSTKLLVLEKLLEKSDYLIVGGGIANTLLAAKGLPVGRSLFEANLLKEAKQLLQYSEQIGHNIILPSDVVVAKSLAENVATEIKNILDVVEDDLILDVGPQSRINNDEILKLSNTIIWNGPLGVFENPLFAAGTQALSDSVANSTAYSLAGGGDTVAAIEQFNVTDAISYISTGGGAFLEFIEGKALPGINFVGNN